MTTFVSVIVKAISLFADVLELFLVARAVLSWFPAGNGLLYKIYGFLYNITEPIIDPFRRMLSRFNTGMFDFSIVLAFFAIALVERLLVAIILNIFTIL